MLNIQKIEGTILRTNNYIIESCNGIILLEASAKAEEMKKITNNKKVLAILLTHGHWDHFYYLDEYVKEFKCRVYLTEQAFQKINHKEKTFSIDRNPSINLQEKDTIFIKENDILNFEDLTFKVIQTKGHTDCSVSYLLNDKFLFSGDTLFEDAVGRCDLPTSDYKEMEKSLSKLFKLKEETFVYPGHGNSTTIGREKNK